MRQQSVAPPGVCRHVAEDGDRRLVETEIPGGPNCAGVAVAGVDSDAERSAQSFELPRQLTHRPKLRRLELECELVTRGRHQPVQSAWGDGGQEIAQNHMDACGATCSEQPMVDIRPSAALRELEQSSQQNLLLGWFQGSTANRHVDALPCTGGVVHCPPLLRRERDTPLR